MVLSRAGRYWETVQRLNLSQLYTAPTAIRLLIKHGNEHVDKYDLSSLRTLGSVVRLSLYKVFSKAKSMDPSVVFFFRASPLTWRLGTGTTRSSAKKSASSWTRGGKRRRAVFVSVRDHRHQVLKFVRVCQCVPCSAFGPSSSTTKYKFNYSMYLQPECNHHIECLNLFGQNSIFRAKN